jgi:Ca2+/Na+ antiporter
MRKGIFLSAMAIFLLATFVLVIHEYYKWSLLTYLLCIATYFLRIYMKHHDIKNESNYNSGYNQKGLYIAQILYDKFRKNNKDVDKEQYTIEIIRLYFKYKNDQIIECNNSNFSCFCAYLDFEFYASEYLTYLPKF